MLHFYFILWKNHALWKTLLNLEDPDTAYLDAKIIHME